MQGLALVVKEIESQPVQAIPECIRVILSDYPTIIEDSTPQLPPTWVIDHRIDLAPRASLLNLAYYKLSLKGGWGITKTS